MRLSRISALFLALLLCACTGSTDEVLPISRAIVGASRVTGIDMVVQRSAKASVAASDERAARSGEAGHAGAPLRTMLPNMIMTATQRLGLTSGREIELLLEIDELKTASASGAMFGKEDRLAGTVFIRDAASNEPLGQLYVDVNARSSGLIGLATRGGVRERIAEAFATRVARALSGR